MDNHLRIARKRAGLSQAEVATRIGKDQGTVSKYENGRCRVDVDVAPKLAEVLGLDVVEVLYGPAESSGPPADSQRAA